MKKNLFFAIALVLGSMCFAAEVGEYELTSIESPNDVITEIYVKKLEEYDAVVRLEYNYSEYACNGETRRTKEGYLRPNANDETNVVKITYYRPSRFPCDIGDAENLMQDELVSFLHDYSKNRMEYLNYKTTSRKVMNNRHMNDFVNNLPGNQSKTARLYTVVEVYYYIY